jgi:hypothetical protein
MRIVWITSARLDSAAAGMHSANATTRYRMLLPARELVRLGHEVNTFGLFAGTADLLAALGKADVVVFNKLLADFGTVRFDGAIRQYSEVLASMGSRRTVVAMDVNDDHFDHPAFRDFYLKCRPQAWTTSTPAMAKVMLELGIGPATVIPDPYEGPAGSAAPPLPSRFPKLFRMLDRFSSQPGRGWRVSLLWFGHPSGLAALVACLPDLVKATREFPLHLHCLSAPGFGVEALVQSPLGGGALTVSFEPWSMQATWAALRTCDVVLLPADASSEKSRVKSANRLIEALRAGRFAVAQPLPAYLELKDFAHVGPSLGEGIVWGLRHPMQALRRVQCGQQSIAERFSPDAVARQWLNSLQSVHLGISP